MDLEEFIASPYHNEWIIERGLTYYVRKSYPFPGSIELANCRVIEDGNTLGFWRFLKRYGDRIPFTAEQVINPDMAAFFRQRKWLEKTIGGIPQFASPLMVERFRANELFQKLWIDYVDRSWFWSTDLKGTD